MRTNLFSGVSRAAQRAHLQLGTAVLGALFIVGSAIGQTGSQDPAFTVGTGANNRIFGMAAQPDGRQIIVGSFTSYAGNAVGRIARITRNGAYDATFNAGSGANAQVTAVAVDLSGKVLVGGTFGQFNGVTANKLVRLNTDGTVDSGFSIGSGFAGGNVTAVAVQSDGRVLVMGSFTSFNGSPSGRIVRLMDSGMLDATFLPGTGTNSDIYAGALDASGRLVIAGNFTAFNGTTRRYLARLRVNGTVDPAFDPGLGPNAAVYTVAIQRDGKVLAGGFFTSFNGSTPASRIARLNANGTYDGSFNPGSGFNSWVYTIVHQGDGKLLVGGDFTSFNGTARNRFARLNTDGSLDTGFMTGATANNWVYAITWQPEGKVTVAGGFTSFAGTARNRIVRLFTGCDDDIQLTLNTDAFGSQTSWELVGEQFTYPICSGSGYADNSEITVSCCVPHGCMRLRVLDSAGDGMATGGYMLRDEAGNRIIDNKNDGGFGGVSSISANGAFCLPMSADGPIPSSCDKLDWVRTAFIVAMPVAEVSAQWGVGDQTDDGYEFWFYDPDGTYSQRKFRNHATSNGFGSGPTRACHLRLGWFPDVNPIPEFVLLNVKIRGRVNGVNREWGPACRFMIDPITAACPPTKLVDVPGQQYFSCGVTRTRSQFVSAKTVPGANRFEFEFVNMADGFYRSIQQTSYHRYLNFTGPELVPGRTYQVRVRVSKDAGASWCPWGESCDVTIAPNVAPGGNGANMPMETGPTELALWPNPNNGERVEMNLTGLDGNGDAAEVVVFDAMGKTVFQERYAVEGPVLRTTMPFGRTLPTGQYLIRVSCGEQVVHQRFVVTH